jgi:uncharacterized surface protein with fasciclin (FAS1) repeats
MFLSRRGFLAAGAVTLLPAAIAPARAQSQTIVGVAAAAGQFGALLAAARAAGLVDALNGPGPLTVFAPTDAAFRRLPKGTVETLLRPENVGQLRAILSYHVVASRIAARDVPHRPTHVSTLNGAQLRVVRRDGVVHVDRSRVVTADVNASNGVVHVINRVLIPGEARRG